jgi:hypothetical protein
VRSEGSNGWLRMDDDSDDKMSCLYVYDYVTHGASMTKDLTDCEWLLALCGQIRGMMMPSFLSQPRRQLEGVRDSVMSAPSYMVQIPRILCMCFIRSNPTLSLVENRPLVMLFGKIYRPIYLGDSCQMG